MSTAAQLPETESVATLRPLCVDLDGTLAKSDTLVDSLLVLLRKKPALVRKLPIEAMRGKASFKKIVSNAVTLDVKHLPYNRDLLHYLQQEHARGREIYLATGADSLVANRVAAHLGIFAGVLGSDGKTNLTGTRKLDGLYERLGASGFDYVGNDVPDLPLLAASGEPMVANPSRRLRMRMSLRHIQPGRVFLDRDHRIKTAFRALRVHQWAKNLLIFVPLLLSHELSVRSLAQALLAFFCFSLTASSAYIVNDMLDIEADRRHVRKRLRPFASGDLSAMAGVGMVMTALLLAFSGARLLPTGFLAWLLLYLVITLAYTLILKRIAVVDVLTLSGLYTLRMLAGGAATGTHISHWLAGFSIFLFFSLAIVKRFSELENIRASGLQPKNGRGYLVADIDQLRSFGTSSAFAAVLVLAIFISSRDVVVLYREPRLLWAIVPLLILWICRVWLLASRGDMDEDPLVFALTDRLSQCIGIAVVAIAVLASKAILQLL